jgi:hypothetical protein
MDILSGVTIIFVIGFFLLVRHWTVRKNQEIEDVQSAVQGLMKQLEVAAHRHKETLAQTLAWLSLLEKRLNRLEGYVEGFDPHRWAQQGMSEDVTSDEELADIANLKEVPPFGSPESDG